MHLLMSGEGFKPVRDRIPCPTTGIRLYVNNYDMVAYYFNASSYSNICISVRVQKDIQKEHIRLNIKCT